MGGVNSFCCQDEKNMQKYNQIVPLTKQQSYPAYCPKEVEESAQKPEYDHPIIRILEPKIEVKPEEEVMRTLEEKYPIPKDKKSLKWSDFEITHRIGSGGFGEVFLGELLDSKKRGIAQKYAIKRIPKHEVIKKKLITNIKLEKKILNESVCNFITTLHFAFRDSRYLYLVMEWAQGGDIYTLINQKYNRMEDFKRSGEKSVRFILGCIILGMEYLHAKNIMYRDLKPENILIFQNGYVKLTDFGLAKEIQSDELAKTEAGTTIYFAPEMVLKQGYGKEVDLWTLGVFAYEISNYSPPFTGPEIRDRQKVKRLVKLAENNRKWTNPNLSDELKNFISSLLRFDPKQRLGYSSWDQIKRHEFFTCVNFSWKELQQMKMSSPLKAIIQHHRERYKLYKLESLKNLPEISKSSEQLFYSWSKNSSQR